MRLGSLITRKPRDGDHIDGARPADAHNCDNDPAFAYPFLSRLVQAIYPHNCISKEPTTNLKQLKHVLTLERAVSVGLSVQFAGFLGVSVNESETAFGRLKKFRAA